MRGAHGTEVGVTDGFGIIPADAGSTRGDKFYRRRSRDHPRGCGEH